MKKHVLPTTADVEFIAEAADAHSYKIYVLIWVERSKLQAHSSLLYISLCV
jgi:hypothetical protein